MVGGLVVGVGGTGDFAGGWVGGLLGEGCGASCGGGDSCFRPQVLKLPLQMISAMTNAIITRMTPMMIQHLMFFHHMCRFKFVAVFLNVADL